MDALRIGRAFRALRIRKRWRQQDLAEVVHLSRQLIAKIESGRIDDVQVKVIRRVGEALGASIDVVVRWQGEGLDRLLMPPMPDRSICSSNECIGLAG